SSNKKKTKIIEVGLAQRKGKKKVTIVSGLVELGMREKTAQSAFRKRFATGVGVDKDKATGKVEVVIQGDVRYEMIKFLHETYKVPPKLLFYRTKSGVEPAFAPEGFIYPPP
ncbi:mitochondrial translation initiation factor, partial [Reticulomyxa filosa]